MPHGTVLDENRAAWIEGDRAAHYQSVAERLERLAEIEKKPSVQARLRQLASDYRLLAEGAVAQIRRTQDAL